MGVYESGQIGLTVDQVPRASVRVRIPPLPPYCRRSSMVEHLIPNQKMWVQFLPSAQDNI